MLDYPKRMFVPFLLFLLVAAPFELHAADEFTISPTALGPLKLPFGHATASKAKLQRLFPKFTIKYGIGQGDSPNFHIFEVSSPSGELLFAIKSFIEEGKSDKETAAEVPISILSVYSRTIPDSYGLRVGDSASKVIARRGKNLKSGWGHFDFLAGDGLIFYRFGNNEKHSVDEPFSLESAAREDLRIQSISWPGPAWE